MSFTALILSTKTANFQFNNENKHSAVQSVLGWIKVAYLLLGAWRCLVESMQTIYSALFMLHIGQLIYEELIRQERTPSWLARKINCERPNVYYIFKQSSINTELLTRISKALGVDFFQYYSDSLRSNE